MALDQGMATGLAAAVEQCLAGCYREESPVFRLSECLQKLRADGWKEAELRRIELIVLKRLVGLMNDKQLNDKQQSADDTAID